MLQELTAEDDAEGGVCKRNSVLDVALAKCVGPGCGCTYLSAGGVDAVEHPTAGHKRESLVDQGQKHAVTAADVEERPVLSQARVAQHLDRECLPRLNLRPRALVTACRRVVVIDRSERHAREYRFEVGAQREQPRARNGQGSPRRQELSRTR